MLRNLPWLGARRADPPYGADFSSMLVKELTIQIWLI